MAPSTGSHYSIMEGGKFRQGFHGKLGLPQCQVFWYMNREKGDAISLDFSKILTEGSCGVGDVGRSHYNWRSDLPPSLRRLCERMLLVG